MRYTHLKKIKGLFDSLGYETHVFVPRMVEHPVCGPHKVIKLDDTITCPNCGGVMTKSPSHTARGEVLYWTCAPDTGCGYSFPAE